MKPHRLAAGLAYLCLTICLRAGTVSLQPDEILQLRALIATNKTVTSQFDAIRRGATAALNDSPNPISRVITEGHLDKDPLKIRTIASLADMGKIKSLGWAWAATGDERFSHKAHDYILAWASMNVSDGDAINETQFEPLIIAYDLMRGTFSDSERQTVDEWLRKKANVLWADHRGLSENWYSHRLKIVGLIGWTINDPALIAEVVQGFHRQINRNFKPDGASTDFYLRDALHYHLYDVEPLLTLARAADRNGEDFFDYAATNGATLKSGIDFVVPFARGEKTHIEFVKSKVKFDLKRAQNGQGEYQPHIWRPGESVDLFSTAAWFRPEYGTLAARLAGHPDEPFFNWQMVLNAVTRHTTAR